MFVTFLVSKSVCCCCFFFLKKNSAISVEFQAVWIQIMPGRPDLGPNCLQSLSADDTSK